jgi:amylosucrase
VDWLTGRFEGSPARGRPFGVNDKTGDARISGSLASLVGLDVALERQDEAAIGLAIDQILLLHGMILSFGGIPLLYYGDEIGTLNDCSFLEDATKAGDSRWIHRPRIDWGKAERRLERGSVEQRLFDGLKKMIAVRKTIPAFADFNNRELLDIDNPHLFAFLRTHPALNSDAVLVVANFDLSPAGLDLANLGNRGFFQYGQVRDLYSGETPDMVDGHLMIPPCRFYWLTDQRPGAVL